MMNGTSAMKKRRWVVISVVAGVVVATGLVLIKAYPGGIATAFSRVDLQMLKGKWQRTDGDYVLEIRSMSSDGKMDAGYFNPSPIHVAKAEASVEGGAHKVFVELRDVNYPGSTYSLTYDSATDSLQGVYYQASFQQSFDVVFERMKP